MSIQSYDSTKALMVGKKRYTEMESRLKNASAYSQTWPIIDIQWMEVTLRMCKSEDGQA